MVGFVLWTYFFCFYESCCVLFFVCIFLVLVLVFGFCIFLFVLCVCWWVRCIGFLDFFLSRCWFLELIWWCICFFRGCCFCCFFFVVVCFFLVVVFFSEMWVFYNDFKLGCGLAGCVELFFCMVIIALSVVCFILFLLVRRFV